MEGHLSEWVVRQSLLIMHGSLLLIFPEPGVREPPTSSPSHYATEWYTSVRTHFSLRNIWQNLSTFQSWNASNSAPDTPQSWNFSLETCKRTSQFLRISTRFGLATAQHGSHQHTIHSSHFRLRSGRISLYSRKESRPTSVWTFQSRHTRSRSANTLDEFARRVRTSDVRQHRQSLSA